MTLAETSVWVDFFRGISRANTLGDLLESNEILLHPWVLGELVRGGLGSRREAVIADLRRLPTAPLRAERRVAGARGRPTSLGTRDRLGRRPPPGLRTRQRLPPLDVRPRSHCGSRGYRPVPRQLRAQPRQQKRVTFRDDEIRQQRLGTRFSQVIELGFSRGMAVVANSTVRTTR